MIEEDNQKYEYLTHGKGRNRKVFHAEIQTVLNTMKTRQTICPKVKTKSNASFASNWEMHDTFLQLEIDNENTSSESTESEEYEYQLNEADSMDSYKMSADEKCLKKLLKNVKFMESVCVIERILANNCYNEQQKIFRGLKVQDDFRENIEYNYKLKYLWTFANDDTKGMFIISC